MKKKKTISKKKITIKSVEKKLPAKTTTLKVGSKMPLFTLHSSNGGSISSKSLLGTRYVLYFYPKDQTPGCTVEAHEFSAVAKKFAKSGVQVFGVSPDDMESHHKFIKKEGITFPLLSDTDHKLALKLGSWVEKSMYGRKYMGINRSTFVVGIDGKIEAIYRDVKPEGHAVCVLGDFKK